MAKPASWTGAAQESLSSFWVPHCPRTAGPPSAVPPLCPWKPPPRGSSFEVTRDGDYRLPQFSSIRFSRSVVSSSVTPWTAARQASLSITNSQSLLELMSIESVMPSNHLILCRPLLLLPSIFPSFRVFSNESVLHIRWPKYWSFSFSISPSSDYSGLISFRMDWLDLVCLPRGKSLAFPEEAHPRGS